MRKLGRILRTLRDAWLILGITLAMLLILEGVLSLVFAVWDGIQACSHTALYGDPATVAAYQDAGWFQEYLRESLESHETQWCSYVYWRRRPDRGQYINIDERGIRRTWAPDEAHARPRDDFTIPSYLAKKLHERGVDSELIAERMVEDFLLLWPN